MKLKFLGFALLAVCVCAVCCMCGSDSKTPDYEFPDGPDPGSVFVGKRECRKE